MILVKRVPSLLERKAVLLNMHNKALDERSFRTPLPPEYLDAVTHVCVDTGENDVYPGVGLLRDSLLRYLPPWRDASIVRVRKGMSGVIHADPSRKSCIEINFGLAVPTLRLYDAKTIKQTIECQMDLDTLIILDAQQYHCVDNTQGDSAAFYLSLSYDHSFHDLCKAHITK